MAKVTQKDVPVDIEAVGNGRTSDLAVKPGNLVTANSTQLTTIAPIALP